MGIELHVGNGFLKHTRVEDAIDLPIGRPASGKARSKLAQTLAIENEDVENDEEEDEDEDEDEDTDEDDDENELKEAAT